MNFKESYNRQAYQEFFQNRFLPDDFEGRDEGVEVPFQTQLIQEVVWIGQCDSLQCPVYEVRHTSENDPRVTLSKEMFRLMAHYGHSLALALFVSSKSSNYRLSLVTLTLDREKDRIKRAFSNPRRYSFYLGPDTKTRTPEEYLVQKGRVKDVEDLQNRFSIEVVNKDFYNEIARLFTCLVGGKRQIGSRTLDEEGRLRLPGLANIEANHQKYQEFGVRLIGRLVFCWFLKKKCSRAGDSLIPEALVSSEHVTDHYYHGIIEPLFFQVLNTPHKDRVSDYQTGPWDAIPFLNGGLFDPHEDDYYSLGNMGFPLNHNTLIIPNAWFSDLFEIFETYNFTIDENTAIDIELSIEPEMLGRIFENLLAEINPETGDTARANTGSFYTPRSVVEYMVDESLKQTLMNKAALDVEKAEALLDYSLDITLSDSEIRKVIDVLHDLRIIDPACGSGAFPMGMLQKLLLILQKVDPDSKEWAMKQLAAIPNRMLRKTLAAKLDKESRDYVHKLGLIQHSIYGVDIQPVAVEISKLRFFLSLIVDETIDDALPNRGLRPLPNLEFKFVCANSLVKLPTEESDLEEAQQSLLGDDFFERFALAVEDYFNASDPQEKRMLHEEIESLVDEKVKESAL